MKNRVAIIGSGDLAEQIAYHVEQEDEMEIIGFFDDFIEPGTLVKKPTKDYTILGGIASISTRYTEGRFDSLFVGIGYQHFAFRKAVFEQFKDSIPFANFIHSSCYVDPSCQLGEGIVLFPSCTLDYGVKLADNVLLNTGCTIAHDTTIDKHTFLSPRVALAGFVTIGECCNMGINTTIIDNIGIADKVQTGGGTVVIKDLIQSGLYVGNPARFVR